jgi:hypothetical protein
MSHHNIESRWEAEDELSSAEHELVRYEAYLKEAKQWLPTMVESPADYEELQVRMAEDPQAVEDELYEQYEGGMTAKAAARHLVSYFQMD